MKNAEDHAQELADHLRSVHFTLMIASAVLLLGASQPIQSDYERAQRDAESIARFEQDASSINDVVRKRIESPGVHDFRGVSSGTFDPNVNSNPYFYADTKEAIEVIFQPTLIEIETTCPRDVCGNKLFGSSFPHLLSVSNITEFEVLWNQPVVHWGLTAAPDELKIRCGDPRKPALQLNLKRLEKAPAPKPDKSFTLSLEENKGEVLDFFSDFKECTADLQTRRFATPVRQIIARELKRDDWNTTTDFAAAFPALMKLTTDNQRDFIPAGHLAQDLSKKALESVVSVELLGLKVPQQYLVAVGGIALILCQFYFLAHLRQLSTYLRLLTADQWPCGYVLLYPSSWVRFVAGATAVAGPSLSLAGSTAARHLSVLGANTSGVSIDLSLGVIGTLISAVLGFRILREIISLTEAKGRRRN